MSTVIVRFVGSKWAYEAATNCSLDLSKSIETQMNRIKQKLDMPNFKPPWYLYEAEGVGNEWRATVPVEAKKTPKAMGWQRGHVLYVKEADDEQRQNDKEFHEGLLEYRKAKGISQVQPGFTDVKAYESELNTPRLAAEYVASLSAEDGKERGKIEHTETQEMATLRAHFQESYQAAALAEQTRRAENEAKLLEEERRKAEQKARQDAEAAAEEERRKAEEKARQDAEAAQMEEERRKAEERARQDAEAAQAAAEEQRRKAEEKARQDAEAAAEEERKKAAEKVQRDAELARAAAEEERKKAEEKARKDAEAARAAAQMEEERRNATEKARRDAEAAELERLRAEKERAESEQRKRKEQCTLRQLKSPQEDVSDEQKQARRQLMEFWSRFPVQRQTSSRTLKL